MLKKLLKSVAMFSLLLGCYFGYIRGFAIVVKQFAATHHTDDIFFVAKDSNSKRTSIAIAKTAMGPDHWSAAEDLGYRYYNAERGYWIYAREAVKIVEEDGIRYDGKRIRLTPFLLIMKSHDGRNTKTITSDVAVIDLNAPLSFSTASDGEPLKIKHAHLEPNVQVRDDKNTPGDRKDDMKIATRTLDYDEPTQQITTDSHVVIEDPDMVTSGDGMLIQLRKEEMPRPAGSSSGFDGAERMDLNKNVHVLMRDVGRSGLMPGLAAPRPTAHRTVDVTVQSTATNPQAPNSSAPPAEPTPLDLRCDWKMQVFLPKPKPDVALGPPEPPAPTLVQFDRNVVVLRGDLDDRPDQLTCDTLKLTLMPSDTPPQPGATPPGTQSADADSPQPGLAQNPASGPALTTTGTRTKDGALTVVHPNASSNTGPDGTTNGSSTGRTAPGATEKTGLFGNLTLQRAHATGHAVWLSLPANGIKLRCNELIHLKLGPSKPDRTYFRGDLTRPLELEKVDVVENEEDPDQGLVTSVTHIRTVDATMYDRGNGMDAADVVANGPGRLETRPGRDQPVERIAIWQDKFYLQNELGPEGQILRKLIVLTGKRPCFIDQAKKSSLDSAQLIKVWLKPKPKPVEAPANQLSSLNSHASGDSPTAGRASSLMANPPETALDTADPKRKVPTGDRPSSGLGGGNFDIERLLALRDVHLLAPGKTMTARERLDAEFVEPKPAVPARADLASANAAASSTATSVASSSTATNPEQARKPDGASTQSKDQAAAETQSDTPPAEPAMVGSAERMWVRMEMKPVKKPAASKPANETETASTTSAKASSTKPASTDTNAEIRNAWFWGSVSLHQDPSEGKTKGQDASGEALYIDNRGEGKVISYVYQREPNEKTYLPGPLPPARVENDDKTIKAAGVIMMNQATDQAWVEGAGTFTQLTERASDTLPAPTADNQPAVATAPSRSETGSQAGPRPTSLLSRNDSPVKTDGSGGQASTSSTSRASGSKPKTRAGRPLSKVVTTTIQFSDGMEFTGRTTDPKGNPAACADFHGVVTALMEDALLHCEERMITYTDQVVPLAQLGAMSKAQSKPKSRAGDDVDPATGTTADAANEEPKPQLALIECYRNAVLINREVDPDFPILLQKKRVEAEEVLFYDKRTGDFTIPGKGEVYLYDRSDNSEAKDTKPKGDPNTKPAADPSRRIVTPTSTEEPDRSSQTTGTGSANTKAKTSSPRSKKSAKPEAEEIPSLVLTRITFIKGMRSQPGTGGEEDKLATHWYEFFGDVQLGRAKVRDGQSTLDFDKLPSDSIFLTGQTLRFITEPPPVGSPASAPGRDYGKVWENAFFRNIDKAFLADSITADVITYDSEKDLIYAYGEGGRGITYGQQHAPGQPASSGTARALRFHPKSGSMDFIDNTSIQLIDKNSGARPPRAEAIDTDAKTKKPPKKGYRIPSNNLERRGFSGQ